MVELVRIGVAGAAWVATYLLHSTILLGALLLISRLRPTLPQAVVDRLWKGAALAGIATATLTAVADVRPLLGRVEVPPAIRAVHVVRELRTGHTGGGGVSRVRRSEQVIRPSFPQPAHVAGLGFGAFLVIGALRTAAFSRRRRRLHRLLRDRSPLAAEPGGGDLVAWLRQLPSGDSIRVSVCDALPGPAAIGRAEICVPRRMLSELDPAAQRGILAHETAHLVRRDPLWLHALGLLQAALFVQPLNRLATARFQRCAEVLCDDWAVAITGRPLALARSIASVAAWAGSAPPAPVAAIAEPGVSFVGRIERLIQARHPARSAAGASFAAALLALLLVGFTVLAAPTVRAGQLPVPVAGEERRVVRMLHVVDDSPPARPAAPSVAP